MPPCLGPLTRSEQFRVLRALPRFRVAVAVLLGFALLHPAASHAPTAPPEPLQAAVAPMVVLGPDDEALSAGALPERFPEDWRKPPCPKAKSVVAVRGACFAVLAEKPPCDLGYEDGGRCLMPIAKIQRTPTTIQR